MDAFHLQCDGSEYAQHPSPLIMRVKQIWVFIRRAGDFFAGRQDCSKLQHMFADGSYFKIIFSMNVRGETAPKVVFIVPETTGGHQPSGSTQCHNCFNVTPDLHRMTPELESHSRI